MMPWELLGHALIRRVLQVPGNAAVSRMSKAVFSEVAA
jgi:hypothetical protein